MGQYSAKTLTRVQCFVFMMYDLIITKLIMPTRYSDMLPNRTILKLLLVSKNFPLCIFTGLHTQKWRQ